MAMSAVIAPPRVADVAEHWTSPPPVESARCAWWRERIRSGWRPNRRVRGLGYHGTAEYLGVYIWEYLEVLYPMLRATDSPPTNPAPAGAGT